MGKPFKIEYRPDNWNAPNGGVAMQWTTPYGGLNVQTPENMMGPMYTPDMNNFMLRNSEISTIPAFIHYLPGPDGNNPILACGSFLSTNQVYHTFAITTRGFFQLDTGWRSELRIGKNPWTFLGGAPMVASPVVWASLAGNLYYTNGFNLCAWDGKAANPLNDVAFTGATTTPAPGALAFGGAFIAELDNHIILAYTHETTVGAGTASFPTRVRWSNNGFNPLGGSPATFGGNLGTIGATFDPNVNVNAGLNDMLDCPDIITGLMTLGRVGYVFRQNGITELSTTGKGIAPFDFNHLWASQNGVGNIYPFSIAQYGNLGVFMSFEQIYKIQPGGLQPIGGGARDAIYSDLALAVGSPKASIDRGFSLGYNYPIYQLRIPMEFGTRIYAFSFEDQNWMRWTHNNVLPTSISNECWV